MSSSHDSHGHSAVFTPDTDPASIAHRKKIWKTFWIMMGITALEFLLAFTFPAGGIRASIFIILTIVKAYYIVAEFMHLKYEVKFLINTVIIPLVFVVWLLCVLFFEGASIFAVR